MKTILALAALATLTTAPAPAATQESMYRECSRDDVPCRLDRLEGAVRELADTRRPGRPVRSERSVGIPVNQQCSGAQACSNLASQLCQRGGFSRGVPAEYGNASGFTVLVRATCMD